MKLKSSANALKRGGFTLIEMLVVIAIIAILIGILTPALRSSMDKAKRARVQAEVNSIKTSIQGFVNDYIKLPIATQATGSDSTTYDGNQSKSIVMALTANDNVVNPRRIVYLESGTTSADGTFNDAWGTQYRIILDTDYNGKIGTAATIAIVESAGQDTSFSTSNDNIRSTQ
jgi:prepilin-type N-terminal cleavage/methylation domain-containing protein